MALKTLRSGWTNLLRAHHPGLRKISALIVSFPIEGDLSTVVLYLLSYKK